MWRETLQNICTPGVSTGLGFGFNSKEPFSAGFAKFEGIAGKCRIAGGRCRIARHADEGRVVRRIVYNCIGLCTIVRHCETGVGLPGLPQRPHYIVQIALSVNI